MGRGVPCASQVLLLQRRPAAPTSKTVTCSRWLPQVGIARAVLPPLEQAARTSAEAAAQRASGLRAEATAASHQALQLSHDCRASLAAGRLRDAVAGGFAAQRCGCCWA